jgi:hypothetical protein
MDPTISELNAITLQEVFPQKVIDNFFLATPLLAYFRDHCLVPFTGGLFMQSPVRYASMLGGFFAPGSNYNLAKRQTMTAMQFNARYAYVSIPEYMEEISVINKGGNAVASLLDADMANGVDTLNGILAVALARDGQTVGRTLSINGWSEALNNGVDPSWDGNIYTTYGSLTRNGAVGATLNSVPQWCGDNAGNPGVPSYALLERGYQDACRGNKEPNLFVSNKGVHAQIKSQMVVQQRFQQERDPVWGVTGFRFNNAMVLKDDYFPSAASSDGSSDPVLGNWTTGTVAIGASPTAKSGYPANTTCTIGGVGVFFNTFDFLFRISDSADYGGGFSGFVPTQLNSRVVGQLKIMANMQNLSPWSSKQFVGMVEA